MSWLETAAAVADLVVPLMAPPVLGCALIVAVNTLHTLAQAALMRAAAEAARANGETELKRAKARSLNADTDDFVRQTAPTPATVH